MSFFIFVIPAERSTRPNRINGTRHRSLQFCFRFERADGVPTFVYYGDTLCTNIIRNDIGSHVKRNFDCGGCKAHTCIIFSGVRKGIRGVKGTTNTPYHLFTSNTSLFTIHTLAYYIICVSFAVIIFI